MQVLPIFERDVGNQTGQPIGSENKFKSIQNRFVHYHFVTYSLLARARDIIHRIAGQTGQPVLFRFPDISPLRDISPVGQTNGSAGTAAALLPEEPPGKSSGQPPKSSILKANATNWHRKPPSRP
jgi:hypothetical protein